MLYPEGQSLLPRVQVSSGEKKQVNEINFSGFAAHFHIAPIPLWTGGMESQKLNLMRLQINIILPPCYTLQVLELKDQKNKETASEFLFSEQHIYKNWDYRCLVPNSHKDPTKWKTYEMHDYRRAFDKEH